jgi:hypothetical protein
MKQINSKLQEETSKLKSVGSPNRRVKNQSQTMLNPSQSYGTTQPKSKT